VDAVAVTGSIATGRSIAAACARRGIPLQAELGGNNAAIVLPDADLADVVPALVRNAFAYSGQRCTAIRRFVVHRDILSEFERRAAAAVDALRIGDAADDADLGPVISTAARVRIAEAVSKAVASGAAVVATAPLPPDLDPVHDAFAPATLLRADDPTLAIVQDETFGPVAVIQPADDLDEAIALANGVEQGLLMAACTGDPDALDRILRAARVGIVQVGGAILPVHPDAPFGGWKASGIGPPEHGVWDAQFLTRPQAVYGPA
jgi:acyl-CoA reductase-like NAD-dependent aldehyde dehydrogenase